MLLTICSRVSGTFQCGARVYWEADVLEEGIECEAFLYHLVMCFWTITYTHYVVDDTWHAMPVEWNCIMNEVV